MAKLNLMDYTRNLKFGLKDYEKTNGRYKNYLKHIELTFLEDTRSQGVKQNYYENLSSEIDGKKYGLGYLAFKRECIIRDGIIKKSDIRQIKTMINQLTLEMNIRFIKWYHEDKNLTKNNKLYIRYYLENYEIINKAMQDVLEEIIEDIIEEIGV